MGHGQVLLLKIRIPLKLPFQTIGVSCVEEPSKFAVIFLSLVRWKDGTVDSTCI